MARSSANRKVAVDSSVIIARITGDQPGHQAGIASLFHEVDSGRVELYGSALLFAEVLGQKFDQPVDLSTENQILSVIDNPNAIRIVHTNRAVGLLARQLRRELRLQVADAVHLASAIAADVDYFMTVDDDFPIGHTVRGVRVSHPDSAYDTPTLG